MSNHSNTTEPVSVLQTYDLTLFLLIKILLISALVFLLGLAILILIIRV